MRTKKVPLRKCVGCSEMKEKKQLVRVVRSPEGDISLDLTGRKPGRGAYVCASLPCLQAAAKPKGSNAHFPARFQPRCTTVWRRNCRTVEDKAINAVAGLLGIARRAGA